MAGQISDVDRARLRRQGLISIEPTEGLALFDAALEYGTLSSLVLTRFDTDELGRQDTIKPILRSLVRKVIPRAASVTAGGLAATLQSLPEQERGRFLADLVRTEASAILGLGADVPIG